MVVDLTAEHARVLCGAPYYDHADLTYHDERLVNDLLTADLVELVPTTHECNCEFCEEGGNEVQLTDAGEYAKQMLRAVPTGVEIKAGRPQLRVVA